MRKFYQVRKEVNMISLFEYYKDTIATSKESLTIKSFRVLSKVEMGRMKSKVPPEIGVGKWNPIKIIM